MKNKCRNLKSNRGITLIALVITIVILLILAGISIAILTGENGIITQSTYSKVEARAGAVQEARDLWKTNQKADKLEGTKTSQSLKELINDLVNQKLLTEDEKDIILGNVEKGIEATGQVTIGSRTIVFDEEDILESPDLSSIVKIGDLVDYHPQTASTTYFFPKQYTGRSVSQNAPYYDLSPWRVFRICGDSVELISQRASPYDVTLRASLGYNNCVYLLNDCCNTLYGNPDIGATARSVRIEDFEELLDPEVWDFRSYRDGSVKLQYGDSLVYGAAYFPFQWSQEKTEKSKIDEKVIIGKLGKSEQIELTTKLHTLATNSIEAQMTYWFRSSRDLKGGFREADTRDPSQRGEFYYRALCRDNYYDYFVASRYVKPSSPVDFGIFIVTSGTVSGTNLFLSNTSNSEPHAPFRPIVMLPGDKLDISSGYDAESGWKVLTR